jgi:hypothetical protein
LSFLKIRIFFPEGLDKPAKIPMGDLPVGSMMRHGGNRIVQIVQVQAAWRFEIK